MNKKKIIYICLLCITSSVFAQAIERAVIGSTGNTISNASTTMSFTVGEIVTTSITNGTTIFSQGFQQGELLLEIKVNPIVFLQGAGINPNAGEENLMRDDLRTANLIPNTSPYNDGLTINNSLFNTTGSNAIVDWVWVELRDANDFTTVVQGQSALLQRDGDVVGTDGISALRFQEASGNYFVAVNHRNHLGLISASTKHLTNTSSSIDMASDPNSLTGGTNAVIVLSNGKYGMFSGDYNEDKLVQNNDAQSVIPLIGGTGYSQADMDANSLIQNTDLNNSTIPNIGRGQQFQARSSSNLNADIHFMFANAQTTNDGIYDYYEADVLIESTEDFKVGSGLFYLVYNTAAFGPNISANGNIEYSQPVGSILGEVYGFPAYKDFIQNDTYDDTVGLSFQQGVSSGTITANNVIATPKVLCHIKIRYVDVNEDPGICFETRPQFLDQFYTACGPTTFGFPDCFNEPGEQLFNDTFDCSGAGLGTLTVNNPTYQDLVLYPNPTTSTFYIKGIVDKASIQIYDMSGKVVMNAQTILSNQTINVNRLSVGVYLVTIKTDTGSTIKKLVIK
ncbi:MAG: T9SS type A sorting domain-containing protein [Flavobacteriaceae bacterium]